jgi:hypothetical protein
VVLARGGLLCWGNGALSPAALDVPALQPPPKNGTPARLNLCDSAVIVNCGGAVPAMRLFLGDFRVYNE